MLNHLLIIVNILPLALFVWPPEHQVNLVDEQEFVISELLDRSDVQDVYDEDELIKQEDLKILKPHQDIDSKKYFRIHNLANKKNPAGKLKESKSKIQVFPEFNQEDDEKKEWIGGFLNNNNEIEKDQDTIYFDEEAKTNHTVGAKKKTRDVSNQDYNYEKMKADYEAALQLEAKKNESLKYKEVNEEETAAEVIQTIAETKNCSEEEKMGMGFGAFKCFLQDSHHKHLSKDAKFRMLKRISLILTLWLLVYLSIVIPLWCQHGWCCCCFRCKFCHPRDTIESIKMFYENNPPGVYKDEDGNMRKYKATTYEIYAHKNLEKAIQRL